MRVGFDIDDTLNDVRYKAIDLFNEKLKTDVDYKIVDQHRDLSIASGFEISEEERKQLWKELVYDIYGGCLPLPNAVEKLNEMKTKGYEIFYITARKDTEEIRKITQDWLIKHGFPFKEENFNIGLKDKEKAVLANELQLDLFFEDKPVVIESLIENKVNFIIKNQVYNQGFANQRRLMNWSDLDLNSI